MSLNELDDPYNSEFFLHLEERGFHTSVVFGILGDYFPNIVTSDHPLPNPKCTLWEPYYLERRKLTSGDDLLYYKDGEYGIFKFDGIIFIDSSNAGMYSFTQKTFIPIEQLIFFPSKLEPETYCIIKNITFDTYIKSAKVIQRQWRKYFEYKLKCTIKIQRTVLHYLYRFDGPMYHSIMKKVRKSI